MRSTSAISFRLSLRLVPLVLALGAASAGAEFQKIDLTIYGMD